MHMLFTARCYAERGYATVSRMSVGPSVRPAVCVLQVCLFTQVEIKGVNAVQTLGVLPGPEPQEGGGLSQAQTFMV